MIKAFIIGCSFSYREKITKYNDWIDTIQIEAEKNVLGIWSVENYDL